MVSWVSEFMPFECKFRGVFFCFCFCFPHGSGYCTAREGPIPDQSCHAQGREGDTRLPCNLVPEELSSNSWHLWALVRTWSSSQANCGTSQTVLIAWVKALIVKDWHCSNFMGLPGISPRRRKYPVQTASFICTLHLLLLLPDKCDNLLWAWDHMQKKRSFARDMCRRKSVASSRQLVEWARRV